MIDRDEALNRSRRNLIALTNALADPKLSREGRRQVHAARAKLAAIVMYREKLLNLRQSAVSEPIENAKLGKIAKAKLLPKK